MPHELEIKRVLPASPQRVFDAWTSAEQMAQWFVANPAWRTAADVDPVVGGHYRLVMITESGDEIVQTGEFKELVPAERVVFTWTSHAVADTLVTVSLRAVDGGTELTLRHEILPTTDTVDTHTDGWVSCLFGLERYLSTMSR